MSDTEKSKSPALFDEKTQEESNSNEEVKLSSLPPPIPDGEPRYVVLQETNDKEMESLD